MIGLVALQIRSKCSDLVSNVNYAFYRVLRLHVYVLLLIFLMRVEVFGFGQLADHIILEIVLPHCEGVSRTGVGLLFVTCLHYPVQMEVDQHRVRSDQLISSTRIDKHQPIQFFYLVVKHDVVSAFPILEQAEHAGWLKLLISLLALR